MRLDESPFLIQTKSKKASSIIIGIQKRGIWKKKLADNKKSSIVPYRKIYKKSSYESDTDKEEFDDDQQGTVGTSKTAERGGSESEPTTSKQKTHKNHLCSLK